MKKIELEYEYYDSLYRVHLGLGKELRFKTETQTKKFIRKYRVVILDNTNILNVLQPQVNLLYRQNVLSLDPQTNRSVRFYLRQFDERFEYIFNNYSDGNQNTFVFSNIESCFECVNAAGSLLYDFSKRYKNYHLKVSVRAILKNMELVYQQYTRDKESLKIDDSYLKVKEVKPLKLKVS